MKQSLKWGPIVLLLALCASCESFREAQRKAEEAAEVKRQQALVQQQVEAERKQAVEEEKKQAEMQKMFSLPLDDLIRMVEEGKVPARLTQKTAWKPGTTLAVIPDKTLLERAFSEKRLDIAARLLRKGAVYDAARILWIVFQTDKKDLLPAMNLMKQYGFNANTVIKWEGDTGSTLPEVDSTYLHWAAASGLRDVVIWLLGNSANPEPKTIEAGQFVDMNSRISYSYRKGSTPADWARISPYGTDEIIALLQKRADELVEANDPKRFEQIVSVSGQTYRFLWRASSAAAGFPLANAFDGNPETYWQTRNESREAWLEFTVLHGDVRHYTMNFWIPQGVQDSIASFDLEMSPLNSISRVFQDSIQSASNAPAKGFSVWMNSIRLRPVPFTTKYTGKRKLNADVVPDRASGRQLLSLDYLNTFTYDNGKEEQGLGWKSGKYYFTGWNGTTAKIGEIEFKPGR